MCVCVCFWDPPIFAGFKGKPEENAPFWGFSERKQHPPYPSREAAAKLAEVLSKREDRKKDLRRL